MSVLKNNRRQKRRGLSLLELIIASSMLAMLMTSVSVVIRTGRESWNAHEEDYVRIEAAHSVLRHVVRAVRRADAVTEFTEDADPPNNPVRLGLRMPDGEIHIWEHDGNTDRVNYGITTPDNLLAPEITGLRLVGLKADGVSTAATPEEVQCLQIEVTIQLPRETNGERVVMSWAWVRSW